MLFHDLVDHFEEDTRVEFGPGCNLGSCNSQSLLQVLFIANQNIHVLDDTSNHVDCVLIASGDIPELLTEVQVERGDSTSRFGLAHRFDRKFRRGWRKRCKDSDRKSTRLNSS